MSEKGKFRTVSLSTNLLAEIVDYVENSPRYRSTAEFVSEAVRLRLEQLEKPVKENMEEP